MTSTSVCHSMLKGDAAFSGAMNSPTLIHLLSRTNLLAICPFCEKIVHYHVPRLIVTYRQEALTIHGFFSLNLVDIHSLSFSAFTDHSCIE